MKLTMICLALGGFFCAFSGCEPAPSDPRKTGDDPAAVKMTKEEKKIADALAELSPEDRELAEEQKICPVTAMPLGSMDKPEKITVEGKEVFICCDGCEEELRKDPAKYLEKIGKND